MEDCKIRREDIPRFLSSYKELKNCEENPEGIELETSEARESLDDTSSDEEVDIITTCDNEKLYCESNITEKSFTSQKLSSASSCSSLTVHVCTYEGCNKFFSRPSRLAQHVRTHTGERPYVCPAESCSRSYARQQHLKRHIEISHQDRETEEKLKCVMCDKMMSNIYNLRKHVQRFHERKRHECSECGQSFTKQQQLQKHTYVHTGIKPYPCDYPGCEMRCMAPSVLKRHKLIHQKSRYVCPQESCQQKFGTHKDLQHHITADHPKDASRPGPLGVRQKRPANQQQTSQQSSSSSVPSRHEDMMKMDKLMERIERASGDIAGLQSTTSNDPKAQAVRHFEEFIISCCDEMSFAQFRRFSLRVYNIMREEMDPKTQPPPPAVAPASPPPPQQHYNYPGYPPMPPQQQPMWGAPQQPQQQQPTPPTYQDLGNFSFRSSLL